MGAACHGRQCIVGVCSEGNKDTGRRQRRMQDRWRSPSIQESASSNGSIVHIARHGTLLGRTGGWRLHSMCERKPRPCPLDAVHSGDGRLQVNKGSWWLYQTYNSLWCRRSWSSLDGVVDGPCWQDQGHGPSTLALSTSLLLSLSMTFGRWLPNI